MARTKQVKPVERTPSSEFVSKQNGTPVKRTSSYVIPKEAPSNGATLAGKSAVMLPEPEKKEAGIVHLHVGVYRYEQRYPPCFLSHCFCKFSLLDWQLNSRRLSMKHLIGNGQCNVR